MCLISTNEDPDRKSGRGLFLLAGVLEVKVAAGWGCSWGAGALVLGLQPGRLSCATSLRDVDARLERIRRSVQRAGCHVPL